MKHFLDNIVWHALTGAHSQYAAGTGGARRYAPGFPAIAGFADPANADFDALTLCCAPGEHVYCVGWSGTAPSGWTIDVDATMFQMLWEAEIPAPDTFPEVVRLGTEHAGRAVELAALTRPGPFGPRNIELGQYFGCFEGARLVAMAGERMHAGTLREISGVCTHPDFQGRGLARRLMMQLIRRQMQRNETPFLHVMRDNSIARDLYERMGFRIHHEPVLRVISRS